MTTVANCFDLNGAMRLKIVLESAGIPVFIPDEVTASVFPLHFINESGVRVQVADEDAAEAREILRNEKADQ